MIRLIFLIILLLPSTVLADCFLNCAFSPGTRCIDGVCVPVSPNDPVPTVAPKPSEIRLPLKPQQDIVAVAIDCAGLNMKTVKIYGTRQAPPPPASFYSSIFLFDSAGTASYYFARKDILNTYRFIPLAVNEEPQPQNVGLDFMFVEWENAAFYDFIRGKTCTELKASGLYFSFGISIKGDRSDYEGCVFTFR